MRKTLKKLISLATCLAFLMTLVPTAMAQTTGIEALTIEDIVGHQPANMITSALTLPGEYEWTAEPAGVIDTATGAVTRHALEDTAVTLTASKDGASESFAVIVKSKMVNIIAKDNFAYGYESTDNPMNNQDFIFMTYQTDNTANHSVTSETDGNSYLNLVWPAYTANGNNYKRMYLRNTLDNSLSDEDAIYFTFNYKKLNESYAYLYFTVGGNDVQFAAINGDYVKLGDMYGSIAYSDTNYKNDGTDAWKTVVFKYEPALGKVSVSQDGVTYASSKTSDSLKCTDEKKLTNFKIGPAAAGADYGSVMLDDFAIYTESFDNLSDEDMAEYVESLIAIENVTSENAATITKNLNLPTCGGLVEWTSSNEAAIKVNGEQGIVTRAENIAQTAVLTAIYSGGSRIYNFAVAPANTTTEYKGNNGKAITLKDDFENGSVGTAIEMAADKSYSAHAGWAKNSTDTVPSFTYKNDSVKGMVGEITDEADEKDAVFYLYAGDAGEKQRFETGFDVNVKNGSFTLSMTGAALHHKYTITNNSITIGVDNTEKTFPITPDENGWVRVDVDSNWAARSQNVYVNGVALTDIPMKNMIYTSANTLSHGGAALRTVTIKVSDGANVLLDNIAVVSYENVLIHQILADAGVKAAQLFYSDREVAQGTLESTGPSSLNGVAYDISSSLANQNLSTTVSKNTTLTWSGANVGENNAFSPDAPRSYTLTVTASADITNYGKATATGTVTVKGAPVVMNVKDGKVSAIGDTDGGTLLIAEYDESGNLEKVTPVTEGFTDIELPDNYRLFFFDSMSTLLPHAFSK